jgi:eukaryotic-like serine/threonine-protein kinase
MKIEPGTRFGPYEVIEQIGSGGMGEVYRAADTVLERQVAIKVLPESFAGDADRVARFEREARTLASLNHPNIAQAYGLEKAHGATAIVMELVEGPTLAERIAAGPVAPEEALAIAYQIIDALEAAHEQRIVHRDLKPANIKLRTDGTVKVLDFGIAKALEAGAGADVPKRPSLTTPAMTQAGVLLGTAAYMSPEQARGRRVDRRADIWAFACVLYEMLTGQQAFGGEDVPLTLARVLAHGTDLDSLPGSISPAVGRTIELCLEKDPKERIGDIGDVRLSLEGRFQWATPPNADPRGRMSRWRRPLPLAAAGAIIAAVGVFAGASVRPPLAVPTQQVIRLPYRLPAETRLNPGYTGALAISADGSDIVVAAGGALILRHLDESAGHVIPGTEGEQPSGPVFAPDGQSILFGSFKDKALKTIRVAGGTPQPVLHALPRDGWSWPTQDAIYYSENCTISRISPGGGPSHTVQDSSGHNCGAPFVLADEDHLIHAVTNTGKTDAPRIIVESLSTGTSIELGEGTSPQFLPEGFLVYLDARHSIVACAYDLAVPDRCEAVTLIDNLEGGQDGILQYALSASGALVYIDGSEWKNRTVVAIADGDGEPQPLDIPVGDKFVVFPAVSPRDDKLALEIGPSHDKADIFIFDLDQGGELQPLTSGGGNAYPTFSGDGVWVAYAAKRNGQFAIRRRRADFSGVEEQLTFPPPGTDDYSPKFAPDGRLAYNEIGPDRDMDIWVKALPDGEPERLAGGPGDQGSVDFAPGVMVYHSIVDSSKLQLMAEPFPPDGSPPRQLTSPDITSGWPALSADGSRVYHQGAGDTFSTFGLGPPPAFQVLGERHTRPGVTAESDNRRQAVLHESDRVVLTYTITEAPANGVPVQIVYNWAEELRQRVFAP